MDHECLDTLAEQLVGMGLRVRWDEPMRAHTTYQIGGPADLFVEAADQGMLIAAVQAARAQGVVPVVLGGGANLLVADAGIRGVVIHYRGAEHTFSEEYGEVFLWTEAGAFLKDLARESIARGLEGLEWAVDVPGTVGGAVVGNAGAYGGYICDCLRSVEVLEPDGTLYTLDNAGCDFRYRDSRFKRQPRDERSIVLSATLALRPGNADEIAGRAAQYTEYRTQRHPDAPSCGSVFKRTDKYPAGFLIEQAGLKGTQRGQAMISPLHANYIVNLGGASAVDVKALIDLARAEVRAQFGEELELEVELVGAW
ncbi:MAG: UDP-N-acetylmuramate dehydrogenase [Anaerolineae bacterium]|nr:UDP-N-acetylmuramate dehydrogenase [Anaerolineae bacterium]